MKIATSTLIALTLLLGGCDDKKTEPAKQTDKASQNKDKPKPAAPMVKKEVEPEPAEVLDEPAGEEPPGDEPPAGESDVGEQPGQADEEGAPEDEPPPE
jgi:hypothetical protein